MPLPRHRIRILGNASNPFGAPADLLRAGTDKTIRIPRRGDVQIEFAFAFAGAIVGTDNIASATLEIKNPRQGRLAPDYDAPVLATDTTAAIAAVTLEDFNAGAEADAMATFVLTGGETANIPAGQRWLIVYVLTNDDPVRKIYYTSALIQVEETGQGAGTAPQDPEETYLTDAQSDARYVRRTASAVPVNQDADGSAGDWAKDDDNLYFHDGGKWKKILAVTTFDNS